MGKGKLNYLSVYVKVLGIFVAFLLIFYWAAGVQLFYRTSVCNRDDNYGNCITEELRDGVWVDQYFDVQADKLESVGILLSSNGKEITSDVYVTLNDTTTDTLLGEKVIAASEIGVNEYHYLDFVDGITGLRGHRLKLTYYSDKGVEGHSATGVYDNSIIMEKEELFVSGIPIAGTLSYSIQGMDDVWTGRAYPFLALGLILIVTVLYVVCAYRYEHGKREFVFETFFVLKKYEFLIKQIVNRDFKVKYKRSIDRKSVV